MLPTHRFPRHGAAILAAAGALAILGCSSSVARAGSSEFVRLRDVNRARDVPIQVSFGRRLGLCTVTRRCPVAIISGGYGVGYGEYSFVANMLTELNYTVVSIQNDLPTDPPLPSDGDLYALRMPIWKRGAENILFVRDVLARHYYNLDFTHLLLVGHSNGGDLSIVFAKSHPELLSAIVTLDNRRVPIPLSRSLSVLSLRSSDMPPVPGVVPGAKERAEYPIKIVQLANAKHDEMDDAGSDATKRNIVNAVQSFVLHLK
jgi:hypothetical protein